MIHELAKKRNLTIVKRKLYEEKWNEKVLRKRCDDIGKRSFDKGYRQKAMTDMEFMFPSFPNCIKYGITRETVLNKDNTMFISTGVDLSGKGRAGTVVMTMGVRNDYKRIPIDIRCGSWSSPNTAKQLADVNNLYKPHIFMVENNAYQSALIDWIQATPEKYSFWMNVHPYMTGKQKWSDMIGLPSLESEFVSGAWIIPFEEKHLVDCKCAWCQWTTELTFYPQSSEGDFLMATWFAREGVRLFLQGTCIEETIQTQDTVNEMDGVFDMLGINFEEFKI